MTKLCLILQPLKKIAADKTNFPVGIDSVRDCDSHVKASPQTQNLETTIYVQTRFFGCQIFSHIWYKTGEADPYNHQKRWIFYCGDLVGHPGYPVCCFHQSRVCPFWRFRGYDSQWRSSRSSHAWSFDKWYCSVWVPVDFIQG